MFRGRPATPALLVVGAVMVVLCLPGCDRGDHEPGFTARITAFADAPNSTDVVTQMDLVVTEPHGLWVYCQGNEPCWVVRGRHDGVWKEGRLVTGCDMGPRFFRRAPGDTLRTVVPMTKSDTISVGVFASREKPPEHMKRERFLKLIRWSSAVVFDSSNVVSKEEWEVRGRY